MIKPICGRILWILICSAFIVPQAIHVAQAQNEALKVNATDAPAPIEAPSHAIAMHGTPKYGPSATHLDYANPHAPKGGTLTQSVIGSFDSLNANNIKGKPAAGLSYLYDRLAARIWDEPFTLYGLIAEKIDVADDRSAITFTLHPDARFHDGTPITAKDVKFSYETLKEYGRPNTRRVYSLVETVNIPSERMIRFTLGDGHDQETVMILAMMPILPQHYWADKDFDATTLEPPLGSGPYRIAEVEAGRRIVYERVPDYWAKDHLVNKGHHNFDRLEFDYYRDKNVAIQAFMAGEFDIFREFDAASWQNNFGEYLNSHNSDTHFIATSIAHNRPEWVRAFIFNTMRKPFDDIKVRKALALAFDFEWMNNTLFHGKTKRITSTFPNTALAADNHDLDVFNTAQTPRQKLRQASALLEEAGWIIKDNKRVHKDSGEPLVLRVILNQPIFEKVVLHWAQSLKRLGIDVNIRSVDSAQFVGLLNEYDYDVVLHRWINSLSPGTEQQIYWGCDAAKTLGSRNYARICDDKIDRLAAQIARATSREDLTRNIHELDRAIIKAHIMVPLYYIGEDFVAYNKKLQRPKETALYGMTLETWWISQHDKNTNAQE